MSAADPIDDAIDAVVRAVDRIERVTRAAQPSAPTQPDSSPQPAAEVPLSAGDRGAPDDAAQSPATGDGSHKKGKKAKKQQRAQHEAEQTQAAVMAAAALQQALAQHASLARGAVPPAAAVPAELHELVGRLVARTQELDEHLTASQQLRGEISELVARIAAVAPGR